MNGASEQVLEILWKDTGRNIPANELEAVHGSSARTAHVGRLRILGLLAALTVLIAAGPRPVMASSRPDGALKAPDFSIMANDGQTYTPDYLKGNVVLLFFWATWCPYCRAAMPHMNDLASEYANASFTIIGICGGKDSDAWHNYIENHHMQWPQYLDSDLRVGRLFEAHGVPNFFLIDKNGYIAYHWIGWDDSMSGKVEKLIDRALAEPRQQ